MIRWFVLCVGVASVHSVHTLTWLEHIHTQSKQPPTHLVLPPVRVDGRVAVHDVDDGEAVPLPDLIVVGVVACVCVCVSKAGH